MIIKDIDELGRIGIPKPLLKELGIYRRTQMAVEISGESIILTKAENICKLCNSRTDVIEGFSVCRSCAEKIADLLKLA